MNIKDERTFHLNQRLYLARRLDTVWKGEEVLEEEEKKEIEFLEEVVFQEKRREEE